MEVLDLKIKIDEKHFEIGAFKILEKIKPSWSKKKIGFKIYSAGITNKLIGAYNITQPRDDNQEIILIRVNGNQTDLLIDREAEKENIKFLHSHGLAPKIYASFENGICYEFIHGVILNPESVQDENIWTQIAIQMAKMHKLPLSEEQKLMEPMIRNKTKKYLNLIPEKFSNWEKAERISKLLPSKSQLFAEFQSLNSKLSLLNSPIVFCHNDLLLNNIIHTQKTNKISFIDFEYAEPNFQAFDIGNHFAKIAGAASSDAINYQNYPTKDFQLKWLKIYLKEFCGDFSEEKVENLFKSVNKFALAGHLMWTCWSLIQAENSTIDFDFIELAKIYYNEYLARKEEFLSL